MNPERLQFLTVTRCAPARLTVEEAAWFLGFSPHEMPPLIAGRLLKPLGNPPPNGSKFFALHELELLRKDSVWLARASSALVKHWRVRNDEQKRRRVSRLQRGKGGA